MRASALSSVMASLTDLLPAKILAPWSANVDDDVNAPNAMNPTESDQESNQGGVKAVDGRGQGGGCARTSGPVYERCCATCVCMLNACTC